MNDKIYNDRIRQILERSNKINGRTLLSFEKQLVEAYKKALKEIQEDINKLFLKFENPTYADVIKFNRLTNLEKNIHDEIQKLTNESVRITRNSIKELFSQNFYYTGFALESTGLKLGFGLLSPKIIEAAILNPMDRIKWTERLKANQIVFERQIKESLTQGLIQGKGYLKIAKTVKDRAEIGVVKVMRILRTEGHRAQNMGNLQGYGKSKSAAKRLGLTTIKLWVHSNVRIPRPDHVEMDDQPANDEGVFTLPSGVTTEAPGLSGEPSEDINCKCSTRLEFQGFGEGKIPPIMSFDEWMSSKKK